MGWYLDGKVSAVIGTHTHTPTADERILPQGTAYITDVGMVGGYNSVIGIRRDQALDRFLTSRPQRFEPGKDGVIFSSVFVEVDSSTGKALISAEKCWSMRAVRERRVMKPDKVYTVSEITQLIKYELESNFSLVWIEGEISDFRRAHSGICI